MRNECLVRVKLKHFTMDSKVMTGLRGYIKIARADHWIKNLFALPGFLVALSVEPRLINRIDWFEVIVGIIALCLISSSNYVLNEILDAPSDRVHTLKSSRPVASGEVNVPAAYARVDDPDGNWDAARHVDFDAIYICASGALDCRLSVQCPPVPDQRHSLSRCHFRGRQQSIADACRLVSDAYRSRTHNNASYLLLDGGLLFHGG